MLVLKMSALLENRETDVFILCSDPKLMFRKVIEKLIDD